MKKRENEIVELLAKNGRIEVAKLADILKVSQVTIRKDLDELEAKKVLRREHGFAVMGDLSDVNNRLVFHYSQKQVIAKKAMEMVNPGEFIMIENGSTCALLADEITRNIKGVTIITNSAFIASFVRGNEGAQVVLLGGQFQKNAQVMVGPLVRQCASSFYVDKFFIGADGYIEGIGFTGVDSLRVQAARDMAEFASKVIVCTESEKFLQKGVTPLNIKDREIHAVTDNKIKPEHEKMLKNEGVILHKTGL